MTLTVAEYEICKKRLQDAVQERAVMAAKREQLVEHLNLSYNLTPEQAREEVVKLKSEVEALETEFEVKYREFNEKWSQISKQS